MLGQGLSWIWKRFRWVFFLFKYFWRGKLTINWCYKKKIKKGKKKKLDSTVTPESRRKNEGS